tara:strand:- start:588 stop:698 length:111 start_codon:yes stop_codon:yes gene_type:complete
MISLLGKMALDIKCAKYAIEMYKEKKPLMAKIYTTL